MCSISNGSRDNSSTRFQRVSITRQKFVTSPTITWDHGDLQWNTLLIDCSSHRGAHFSHWDFCSISNGSRDNPSSRFQRVSITRQRFVTSPTITWDPGDLQWNTLLIDCSSHRGTHFSNWDFCSISNGSRDNPSSRFQRVSITRHQFVTSPTITWDPGDLQWNTLLIDCSSHRGAHFSHWDFCSISNGSRTLLIDCSSHRGAHFCHWLMCSISNASRYNSSTRFQRVSITRQKFVTSPTITWDPGDLQWNTLLIDCSSHRAAHFSHWDFCSISNGSRDNPSSRFQRVSITRH